MSLTCEQLRAARAVLQWRLTDLAEKAGVSLATIQRAETKTGKVQMNPLTERAIRQALEAADIEFLPNDDNASDGIRWKQQ